jgi:hypothetical protein
VFDFVLAIFLDSSPTKFNFNVRSPTSRFSNRPASNDPSPLERHSVLLFVFISHLRYTFFCSFSFAFFTHLRGSRHRPHAVSFFIRHLISPRDGRCWRLEFSLIVVDVVVVLSSSSLEPKLELLSYPPSGDGWTSELGLSPSEPCKVDTTACGP